MPGCGSARPRTRPHRRVTHRSRPETATPPRAQDPRQPACGAIRPATLTLPPPPLTSRWIAPKMPAGLTDEPPHQRNIERNRSDDPPPTPSVARCPVRPAAAARWSRRRRAQDATPDPYAVERDVLAEGTPAAAPESALQLVRITIPPHAELAPHTHPGMQVSTVDSGTLLFTVIEGEAYLTRADGTTEVITPESGEVAVEVGDALVEPAGMIHFGRNGSDEEIVPTARCWSRRHRRSSKPPPPPDATFTALARLYDRRTGHGRSSLPATTPGDGLSCGLDPDRERRPVRPALAFQQRVRHHEQHRAPVAEEGRHRQRGRSRGTRTSRQRFSRRS